MKKISISIVVTGILWLLLTLWVEKRGVYRYSESGPPLAMNALIIYDPDPFYNLDQQICESYAEGLKARGWNVTVASVRAAPYIKEKPHHLYVFCANTYNWSPDWAVTDYLKKSIIIKDKNVVAITLGIGSTESAKLKLEHLIELKEGRLIDSRTWWLWRPNDEKSKEPNVKSAVRMAKEAAENIVTKIQ